WWRGTTGCLMSFSEPVTRAWRYLATLLATRSVEYGRQAAARDRARRVLDRRLLGAAPQGQNLSRLQRSVPDRRRDRLMPRRDGSSQGFPGDCPTHERTVRSRYRSAQVFVCHASGDATLRRPRARAEDLSRYAPVR